MKSGGGGGGGGVFASKKRWRGLAFAVFALVILSMLVPLVFLLGLQSGIYTSSSSSSSSSGYDDEQQKSAYGDVQHNSVAESKPTQHIDEIIKRLAPIIPKQVQNSAEEDDNKNNDNDVSTNNEDNVSKNNDDDVSTNNEDNNVSTNNDDNNVNINNEDNVSTNNEDNISTNNEDDVSKNTENDISINTDDDVSINTEEDENKDSGNSMPVNVPVQRLKANNTRLKDSSDSSDSMKGIAESLKFCEFKFGSYCLWRRKHTEPMNDSMVKKMKDLLYVARAYYPSIAKMPKLDKFTNEMKQNIQEFEKIMSESTTDKDLPSQVEAKIVKMEGVIQKAKTYPVECSNVDKKFRQLVELTEDETNFHMKQSAFLYQLAVQTMPKSLHCLSMRLTVEYFKSNSPDLEDSLNKKRYVNPNLQHYVVFSNNVLGASVVINSTVVNAEESGNQVFHILTDRENFFAMKMWFFVNKYKEAVIQVLNVEELVLNNQNEMDELHLSLSEEFRILFHKIDKDSGAWIRTEYISVFSHLHYFLPVIFPNLKKIVVLDGDVVIQRDLSSLWNMNMDGKVLGAVQICSVKFGPMKNNEDDEGLNEDYCAWMSGINVVDLARWREQDLTKIYQSLVPEVKKKQEGSSDGTTLLANMLTFQGNIYPFDDELMMSGLGHNYGLDVNALSKAAVLHYNGNMKPWLEIGITNYIEFWSKYLDKDNQFLRDCNVNTFEPKKNENTSTKKS